MKKLPRNNVENLVANFMGESEPFVLEVPPSRIPTFTSRKNSLIAEKNGIVNPRVDLVAIVSHAFILLTSGREKIKIAKFPLCLVNPQSRMSLERSLRPLNILRKAKQTV